MRICQVCRGSIFHQHGGMLEAAWDSCVALAAAGHTVGYLTTEHPKHKSMLLSGVHIDFMQGAPAMAYSEEFFRRARERFDVLNEKAPFDLVISHSKAARDFLINGPRVRCPVAMVDHGIGWARVQNECNAVMTGGGTWTSSLESKILTLLRRIYGTRFLDADWHVSEREMLLKFDKVIVISEVARLDAMLRGLIPNVTLLHSPCAPSETLAMADGPLAAIFSSRARHKGMHYLEAVAKESKQPIRAVGAVPAATRGAIQYTGIVPPDRVLPTIAGCSVYMDLSTHYSGFNMATTKAMSCGMPIVGWQTPTMYEIDRAGAGIMVPTGSVHGLVAAVRAIQARWRAYSARVVAFWNGNFSPSAYASAVEIMVKGAGNGH